MQKYKNGRNVSIADHQRNDLTSSINTLFTQSAEQVNKTDNWVSRISSPQREWLTRASYVFLDAPGNHCQLWTAQVIQGVVSILCANIYPQPSFVANPAIVEPEINELFFPKNRSEKNRSQIKSCKFCSLSMSDKDLNTSTNDVWRIFRMRTFTSSWNGTCTFSREYNFLLIHKSCWE